MRHRKNSKMIAMMLLLSSCCLQSLTAQNLNTPNKTGPLGIEVNTLTGNVFISRTDAFTSSRGIDISLKFSYNSFDFDQNIGFGNGWTMAYAMRYRTDSLNNKIITWGDGREDIYKPNGANFNADEGIFTTLSQYQPNKYLLTMTNGMKFYFDNPVYKKLTKVEERNGNSLSFIYTDSLLTTITTSAGQSIVLAYNANGNLQTITDAITLPARITTYLYDGAGNLLSVTNPLGGKMKYAYMVNGPMKSMTDENNNTVDIIYYGDITCSELIGCNKRQSFSYDTTLLETTCTDYVASGNNQVTKYTYQKQGDNTWLSKLTSNCCGYNMVFAYDQHGNKISETDANGNVTSFSYDAKGNALTITDALGHTQQFTYSSDFNKVTSYTNERGFITNISYDTHGNLTQISEPGGLNYTATYAPNGDILTSTDPKGNTFIYSYDSYGNPLSVTGPNNYHASLGYDARGNLVSLTDARGNNDSLEYDILNRLKKVTDPLAHIVTYSYDLSGNPTSYINENNQPTTVQYDASDRPVVITNALGHKTILGFDAMDNVVLFKNALGNSITLTYDTRNRLSSVKDALGNTANLSYDPNGNIISLSLPNGNNIQYTYDALNRLKTAADNTANIFTYNYDPAGNITSIIKGSGATYSFQYDNKNRITQFTDPLGNSLGFTYDNNDNVVTVTDRNNKTRNITYDSLNRVKTVSDNQGNIITRNYDNANNLTSITDQNSHTTSYTYDSLSRVKRITYPDSRFIEYTYDNVSNIINKKAPDGTIVNYTYDSLNRITSRILPGGDVYTYTYDSLSRIKTATNSNGTVVFAYDALDRLISEDFNGRTVSYNYNIAGRTQTTIYPDSTVVTKNFDTRNRLINIFKNNTPLVTLQYDINDNVIQKTFANGVITTAQYDANKRLIAYSTGTGGNIQNATINYDNESNKTALNRLNTPAKSEQYSYDNNYRLVDYKKGPVGSPLVHNTYTYDALGNRTVANLNGTGTTYTVNNLNQITSSNGGININYQYDNNGNLTYDGRFYKTYDAEGRLLKDSASPANQIIYSYDPFGRRIQTNLNGVLSNYTYAGLQPIEERNASGTILNRTVFNNFLTPLYNEKNGTPFYYHQNELMSVEAITNTAGSVQEKYDYDVYGKQTIYDGNGNVIPGSTTGNRFGFTGQVYDTATGSNKFFYREYNPETGIFNERDLIGYGDGMGMYQYVHNNPANGIDVLGLSDCPPETAPPAPAPVPLAQQIADIANWRPQWWGSNGFSNVNSITTAIQESLMRGNAKEFLKALDEYKSANTVEKLLNADSKLKMLNDAGRSVLNNKFLKFMNGSGMGKFLLGVNVLSAITSTADLYQNWNSKSTAQATDAVLGTGSSYVFAGGSIYTAAGGVAGTGLIAVSGGLAIYGITNEGVRYFTGKSISEHGENWEIPIFTGLARVSGGGYFFREFQEARDDQGWTPRIIDCPQNGGRGKRTRKHWYFLPNGDSVEVIQSHDPNAIIGPDGQPPKAWVSVHDRLPYTILYENSTAATAPAKFVHITSPAENKQDVSSFQLGTFGFNNQTFTIPPGTASYYQRLDCRDSLGLYVDITAGYDVTSNKFFWDFQSVDPTTLLPPTNPLKGFLLLQDTTRLNNGHAFVNFSIKPVQTAITLDTISAHADIVFDGNDTIPTNRHKNTIDAFAPTTHMNNLPATSLNVVNLTWTGSDDVNGCGIRYYTLYVSNDGINFSILRSGITRTDTTFRGINATTYYFFVLGTDSVGNTETLRPGEVKSTFFSVSLPVTWLSFRGTNLDKDNLLEWTTGSEQNSREFIVERSLDAVSFIGIGSKPAAGNSSSPMDYNYTDHNVDRLGSEVMFYRLKQVDIDGRYKYSGVVRLNISNRTKQTSIVYPNPTNGMTTIAVGDKQLIGTKAELFDGAGRMLMEFKITANTQTLDLSRYVNGIYLVRLSNKEVLRIVKQ